eukprot:8431551-Heterocapsa_arctica.AAC.1
MEHLRLARQRNEAAVGGKPGHDDGGPIDPDVRGHARECTGKGRRDGSDVRERGPTPSGGVPTFVSLPVGGQGVARHEGHQ